VAAWLSETVLRGRGPGASGFEFHRRGGFFQGRNLRRAMDVCVCLTGADGRVVEGRATLFRHHREVSRVRIPVRMGLPWMFVFVFVLWRPEKGERRREGGHHCRYWADRNPYWMEEVHTQHPQKINV
jgi:hypothetical protein